MRLAVFLSVLAYLGMVTWLWTRCEAQARDLIVVLHTAFVGMIAIAMVSAFIAGGRR